MTMGRLMVPALAFAALLVGLRSSCAAREALPAWQVAAVTVAVAVLGALPLGNVHLFPTRCASRSTFGSTRAASATSTVSGGSCAATPSSGRDWDALATIEAPGDSIVLGAIGAIACHSDLFVYDRYGLVTREVAMREVSGGRNRSPGHDKHVPITYFLDDEPTARASC